MTDNDRTDALPRSGAVAWGFAWGCRAVLLLSTVFLNIIIDRIENKCTHTSRWNGEQR
jgi:hypothetical protein